MRASSVSGGNAAKRVRPQHCAQLCRLRPCQQCQQRAALLMGANALHKPRQAGKGSQLAIRCTAGAVAFVDVQDCGRVCASADSSAAACPRLAA